MNKQRPVNLQLTSIKFPSTAIVSILHRISGVVLFLSIPILLWVFSCSLSSARSFHHLQVWLAHPLMKFILWGILAMLIYHFVAGVRHLLMDYGFAEAKQSGKTSAVVAIVIAIVVILVAGIIIW